MAKNATEISHEKNKISDLLGCTATWQLGILVAPQRRWLDANRTRIEQFS